MIYRYSIVAGEILPKKLEVGKKMDALKKRRPNGAVETATAFSGQTYRRRWVSSASRVLNILSLYADSTAENVWLMICV